MTPQGQAAGPAQQPGWFSQNWKWVVGLGCLGALLCCGVFSVAAAVMNQEADGARVDCGTPGPDGVDCDLKRTSGSGALKACWDLEITCTNGAKMRGNACGTVAAGQPSGTANMAVSTFSNQDQCDAPASGAVQNLTVQSE